MVDMMRLPNDDGDGGVGLLFTVKPVYCSFSLVALQELLGVK